jgi:hypothetical protein
MEILRGLTKAEVKRYLIQLVIKKRKYHLRVKSKSKTKDVKLQPPVRNEPPKLTERQVYKPPNALTLYVDKTDKPTQPLKDNVIPLLTDSEEKKDTLTKVTQSREERATESRAERAEPPPRRMSDLQEAITSQLSKLKPIVEEQPLIEEQTRVEELPEGEQNPIYKGIDLINLKDLKERRDEIKKSLGNYMVKYTEITKGKVDVRKKVFNDFLQLYPEERDNVNRLKLKNSKDQPPSGAKIREYIDESPDEYKFALTNSAALKSLLSQIMPIDNERKRNIRNFLIKALYDKDFFNKEVAPDEDRVFHPESGLIMNFGSGHFKHYKDGLYDHEIQEIMKDHTKRFVPVIMSDEIPSLLHYITPKTQNFGFVINTRPSSERGIHWMAIYLDRDNQEVDYYDPLAEHPPSLEFLRDIKLLVEKMRSPYLMKLKVNNVKVQGDHTSNCGFFCIRFLIERMSGMDFKEATRYDDSKRGEKEIKKFKEYI